MKVHEITVSAGRTFNHPYESYSNFKPSITIKATIDEGEDADAVIKSLQAKAESMIEDHKRHVLSSLEELENMTRRQQEARSLERTIRDSQDKLDRLRQALPDIQIGGPIADTDEPSEEDENLF